MSKRPVVPGAEGALDRFRMEIANELGIPDSGASNQGVSNSHSVNEQVRAGGNIGGQMVKRMIQHVEEQMANENK